MCKSEVHAPARPCVCVKYIQYSVILASLCLTQTQSYFKNNPLSLLSVYVSTKQHSIVFSATVWL